MADECFPGAEDAFRDAFNQPDPSSRLLELLNAHPEHAAITDLVSVYMQLVAERPDRIHELAGVLVKLAYSKEPTISSSDRAGNPGQQEISAVLNRELCDFHGGDLVYPEKTAICPSNDYLIASLLSAASMKYGLCDSPAQAGSVVRGLHLSNAETVTYEVFVLGACLQLLVAGSHLYGPGGIHVGKEDVPVALERLKGSDIVNSVNGRRLLDAAIEHAKSGFNGDLDNAWAILFPQGGDEEHPTLPIT